MKEITKQNSKLSELYDEYKRHEHLSITRAGLLFFGMLEPKNHNKEYLRKRIIDGTMYIIIEYLQVLDSKLTGKYGSINIDSLVDKSITNWVNSINKCIDNREVLNVVLQTPYKAVFDAIDSHEVLSRINVTDKPLKGESCPVGKIIKERYSSISEETFGKMLGLYISQREAWSAYSKSDFSRSFNVNYDDVSSVRSLVERTCSAVQKSIDSYKTRPISKSHMSKILYVSYLKDSYAYTSLVEDIEDKKELFPLEYRFPLMKTYIPSVSSNKKTDN